MKLVLVTLAALLPSLAAAAERVPALKPGVAYAQARARLVAAGWRPAPPRVSAELCGIGREDMCRPDRPEVKSCAGTGLGACRALWTKRGTVIEIITIGDVRPTIRSVRCITRCR